MKSTRFNFGRALAALIFAAALVFGFTGCNPQVEYVDNYIYVLPASSSNAIVATWGSSDEKFEITESSFVNYYSVDYGDAWISTYKGENLYVLESTPTSGYVYFKYTKALCSTHSDFESNNYVYDSDPADVGKWYAVSYKNLTDSSVSISGAYSAGGVTSTSTLKEAVEEFTIDNGYFSYYSELVKSE